MKKIVAAGGVPGRVAVAQVFVLGYRRGVALKRIFGLHQHQQSGDKGKKPEPDESASLKQHRHPGNAEN